MDHTPSSSASGAATATSSNAMAASHKLKAGRAITLRAKELSVLRISHGRVWATLTNVGPYSRVPGGDHFLSRGQSLTLLPGQQLVMESFGIGHTATAFFNWEDACAAAITVPALAVHPKVDARADANGVAQPLRDLRHALGMVVGASGRLVNGLAHGAAAAFEVLPTNFAMVFVAARARKTGAGSTFNASKGCSQAQLADCRSL
ncbi:MAG: DUF2917 domain-containing protein [Polaromonas sp.]|nr:DUF2917 domain-containing protein [Polaromonas sp.]